MNHFGLDCIDKKSYTYNVCFFVVFAGLYAVYMGLSFVI